MTVKTLIKPTNIILSNRKGELKTTDDRKN